MGNECWTTSWHWVAWEEWRGTIGEGRVVSDECRVTIAAAEMAARMAAAESGGSEGEGGGANGNRPLDDDDNDEDDVNNKDDIDHIS